MDYLSPIQSGAKYLYATYLNDGFEFISNLTNPQVDIFVLFVKLSEGLES